METTELTQEKRHNPAVIALCFSMATVALGAILLHPALGYDWIHSFGPAGRDWLHPYEHVFHNPPWVAFFLWPIAALPLQLGVYVNLIIMVTVVVFFIRMEGGNWLSVLVTILSPPFYHLFWMGNIEWIPMLGALIGGGWGVPLMLAKPQVMGLIPFLFFKRAEYRWRFWLPMAGVILISFMVWGLWPFSIPQLPEKVDTWNWNVFPWGVPFGIWFAYLAWKRDALRWGLLATLLLAPYFGPGSLVPLVAAWSAKYPRAVGAAIAFVWMGIGWVLYLSR